jgi:hypothetical protein
VARYTVGQVGDLSRSHLSPAEEKECWARKRPGPPVFVSNPGTRKLLDDTEALLYCDHQFDRQIVISLS